MPENGNRVAEEEKDKYRLVLLLNWRKCFVNTKRTQLPGFVCVDFDLNVV